ncbi:unnamed protein product [Calypogeia fissa]
MMGHSSLKIRRDVTTGPSTPGNELVVSFRQCPLIGDRSLICELSVIEDWINGRDWQHHVNCFGGKSSRSIQGEKML